MNPYSKKNLRQFFQSIPADIIEKNTALQNIENERLYHEFIEALKIGKCFICGNQMSYFQGDPCFHWFTYPKGIKKKHFKKYLSSPVSFFRLDSYFRWLANSENPLGNINDIQEEKSKASYLETTIKYKNIEWAFSIAHSDKKGHPNSYIGHKPHYHLQMKIDGNIFLKFNDFHIQFTDEDLFFIELREQAGDIIQFRTYHGEGMGLIEDEEALRILDENMKTVSDETKAQFNCQSLIEMPLGQTMDGEIIIKAMEESKKTKEPIRKVLKRMLPTAKITTYISPSDNVPQMIKRGGKK